MASSKSPTFLTGPTLLGPMIASADWSGMSIGAPDMWPASLRTLVGVIIRANQPMFVVWGDDHTLIYNDPYADVLGHKHPAALGQPFLEVWSEARDALQPLIDQVLGGEPVHMDDITLFLHRKGRPDEAHFAFSYTPVHDDDGRVVGFFCPCTETTAQVTAEKTAAASNAEREHALRVAEEATAAAEEANTAKSTFIANMSHELRTPLSAIIGYSEMMIEEAEEGAAPDTLVPDMRKVETNARHLLSLINDVLDLSKVESGKMDVYAEEFDVRVMIDDIAVTVGALMAKKSNTLVQDIAPDVATMVSDLTKVRQSLLNLLGNAAKFTDHGIISLIARTDRDDAGQDCISFSVRDSGIGMTEQQVAKLFQRFQQGDASTTRRFGGTGLGLSITQAFSAMLGGSVTVESTLGQGSTFTLRVPMVFRAPEAEPAADRNAGDRSGGAEPVAGDIVLVIDDDAAQRELMSRFLEREGFVPRTAVDGMTGLDLARTLHPRAILLDVMMPGIDGWAVLTKLKADPELTAIPVVMVSFVNERGLASALGAADYVPKPVKWEHFRQVMDRFRDEVGHVLLIDDDLDFLRLMRRSLEGDGWVVEEAKDGREALEAVGRRVPRVILLDLVMPVMDGFAFLQALRAQPGCAEVPVVVLTARDLTRDDRKRLSEADQVLTKTPATLRELGKDLKQIAAVPT